MSNRELMGLAPNGWHYAGRDQDTAQLDASFGPRARRSSLRDHGAMPAIHHPAPTTPLGSAPDEAVLTPPSSVPTSSPTSCSVRQDPSSSDLSSVEDVSDWTDAEEKAPKRRKLSPPPACPSKSPSRSPSRSPSKATRRLSAKAQVNLAAKGRPTRVIRLKLNAERLQGILTKSPVTLKSPVVPATPIVDPGLLTLPPSSSQQIEGVDDTTLPDASPPEPTGFDATATSLPTPPRSTRKRRRSTKEDVSPKLGHLETIPEGAGRQPAIADPIAESLEPLVHISRRLMGTSSCPLDAKPAPVGHPEVWADGRQALCESLPYYRAYQSAGYCTAGFAYSFMFDQEGCPRDYMDAELVIARSGGGLSRDKITGKMARQADQCESSQVRSVRNSMVQFNPVAILSGGRNQQCPSKMPHAYNILDWFKPTHIWAEKFDGKVNIRYRFEKLTLDKPSWWAPSGISDPARVGSQEPPHVETCLHCNRESQQVYLQGWMCLQLDCQRFWTLQSGNEPQEGGLLYDPRFLKQHTPWPHASAPQPLRPSQFALGPRPMLGDDVSWTAAKGLVCPRCGRCNSREAWEGWYCGNPACDFAYSLPHANVPADALHDAYNPLSAGYALSKDVISPDIALHVDFAHNYRINYFTIPGVDGFVAHLIANKTVNEEAGGPDDMWTDLQTADDLGLRRRPIAHTTLQGPMLTQHFCVNYGMPYKFIAATSSKSFSAAARPIAATRSRLNWAARHCVGAEEHTKNGEFNELLALGYFEKQKIDYHDDGEYGLGPTIATLSVGAPASMKLRMKAKHYLGVSKTRAYVTARPLPGCLKYEERLAAYAELEELKKKKQETSNGGEAEAAAEAYRARLAALPDELGLQVRGTARDVLNLHLGHGDIVIMHGRKIQEYYEHAVDPIGKLRFALTCRYIDGDSLKLEDRPEYEVEPDNGGYDGSRLPPVGA